MQYDEEYLNWKSWDLAKFGTLSPDSKNYYAAELKRAGVNLQSQLSVLEIGFGSGQFMGFCRSRNWSVTGIEANPRLVEAAAKHGFEAFDVEAVSSMSRESYDLIAAFDVFEHLSDQSLSDLLKQLHGLLRRGGKMIARFPNGDSPISLPLQNGDASHYNTIGSQKAICHFLQAGFKEIRFFPEAQPIWRSSSLLALHRIFAAPLKMVFSFLIQLVFYPRSRIFFLAANLCFVATK
jgi:2-polyprenyl-3-methyl-5-hydroxy-6-metoxy-1,4-benzoquinol methylase